MIARTLLQTFSTIVTAVVSPHAKEVNYIECVRIDYSVKIMNLIDCSRNIYLLLHLKCHIYAWNTDLNLYISHRFFPFLHELILMKYIAAKHLRSLW